MTNFDYRIPDDMAAEVLAEATRLHAETSKGYSFADLEQACSEAQIPPHIVRQAIKNVEDKRLREQTKRQQLQEHIKQQVKRGMFAGIAILIPAVAISSIFLFRSQLKPVVSGLVSGFNLHQQRSNAQLPTLTVQQGKLEYFTDPKGLSIAVRNTGNSVEGIISTDDYENLPITLGQVGDSYEYKGIYDYRIKIIGVTYDSATFQIEQQGQQPQSAVKRLEHKVNELQEKSGKLQKQIKTLQEKSGKLQSQIKVLEGERGNIKQQLEEKNKEIERLEKENDRLKFPALYN